jgi:hypothetical protein
MRSGLGTAAPDVRSSAVKSLEERRCLEEAAMSSKSGREENRWETPPYPVVKACQRLGFQSPLDVRWCRLSQALGAVPERSASLQAWIAFFWGDQAEDSTCLCGHPLPMLERYTFNFASGKAADYFLGQCWRCRTIIWEQASLKA